MKASAVLAAVCCICLLKLGAANSKALPDPSAGVEQVASLHQHDQQAVSTPPHTSADVQHSDASTAGSSSGSSQMDAADQVQHTYFRPQAALISSDASSEENIPGLEPTDPTAVKRAIPNLEQWSPFLTMLAPVLPHLHDFTNLIGFYLPVSWPLAAVGPTGDWLHLQLASYWHAFWGEGPRPPLANTLLVANEEAYKKLSSQLSEYSGLKAMAKQLLNPVKAKLVGWALYDQLTRNMMLPHAPLLMEAANGTIVTTQDGLNLTLVVKEDGRYLVSNTTTAKIVKEIEIKAPFPSTFVVVDSFIVNKVRLVPRPLPPLLTKEEIQQLPELLSMYKDAMQQVPDALRGMPVAVGKMIQEQVNAKRTTPAAPTPASVKTLIPGLTLNIGHGRR